MKSKRASIMIYGIMLSLVVLVLTMALAPAGKQFINDAMNVSTADVIGLDCANESISSFNKATCTVVDFSLFWFFGSLIFIAGAIITGRIVFS